VQDRAADIAEQGYEALMRGGEQVVTGTMMNRLVDVLGRYDRAEAIGRSTGGARRPGQPLMRPAPFGPDSRLDPKMMCFVPAALVVVVVLLDLAVERVGGSALVVGLLDEPAHLATAALVLLALPSFPLRATVLVLVGSVGLDVDHIPLYLHVPHVAAAGGRPVTHSLLSVAVLLLAAGLAPRGRPYLLPLAGGVLLHFVRDIATGPGIPLLWPYNHAVLLPYELYLAILIALTLFATAKRLHILRLRGSDRW
jgi:inner membrane protein